MIWEIVIISLCLKEIALSVSTELQIDSLNCQVVALYFKSNLVLKLDLKPLRKELQGGFHTIDLYLKRYQLRNGLKNS